MSMLLSSGYSLPMPQEELKIFISWSGDLSKAITRVIRVWLPKLFDHVDPWMSDVDIQAGTRGLQLIEERLNESSFGIIVVTTENQDKTWINFEAGALSKRFAGSSSYVVPILVNFDDFYQVTGPIRQFQGVMLTKDGMRDLLQSICNVAGADWPMVEARFEWSWPEFEAAVDEAKKAAGEQPPAPDVSDTALLEEILRRMSAIERASTTTQSAPVTTRTYELSSSSKRSAISDEERKSIVRILKRNGIEYERVRISHRFGDNPMVTAFGVQKLDAPAYEAASKELEELGFGLTVRPDS
jgi:hypothetical protein